MLGTGDFNLAFLDLIKQVDGLKWSGNCNELNAAYAADGTGTPPLGRKRSGRWADIWVAYARVTSSLGCIVTTFGYEGCKYVVNE